MGFIPIEIHDWTELPGQATFLTLPNSSSLHISICKNLLNKPWYYLYVLMYYQEYQNNKTYIITSLLVLKLWLGLVLPCWALQQSVTRILLDGEQVALFFTIFQNFVDINLCIKSRHIFYVTIATHFYILCFKKYDSLVLVQTGNN